MEQHPLPPTPINRREVVPAPSWVAVGGAVPGAGYVRIHYYFKTCTKFNISNAAGILQNKIMNANEAGKDLDL
jgi:hypothetical protein